jgi:hypothetical protein
MGIPCLVYLQSLFSRPNHSTLEGKPTNETSSSSNMLSDKVTINLNVFGAIMKDIIMSNLNSTAIVATKDCGRRVDPYRRVTNGGAKEVLV